jgi:tetratricopeptide (TPR) repeat protein
MPTIRSLLDQAKAALVAGKAEAALAPCRAILEKYPKQLEATCLLAEACRELRQLPEALDLFERVVSADPESLIGHWGLSTILEEQGHAEAAQYELRVAWDLSPGHPAVREELLRLRGGDEPSLSRAGLARVYWRGHQYRRAIAEARACLLEHPERLDVGVLLAEVLWRMGRADEAADLCGELLADSPDCVKANLIRGYILKDGRKLLGRALQLDPECRVAVGLFAGRELPGPLSAGEVDLDAEPVSLQPAVAEVSIAPPARVSVLAAAALVPTLPSEPTPSPIAAADEPAVPSLAIAVVEPPASLLAREALVAVSESLPSPLAAQLAEAESHAPLAAETFPTEDSALADEEPLAAGDPAPDPAPAPDLAPTSDPAPTPAEPLRELAPVPGWLATEPTEGPAEAVAAAGLDPNLYAEWADLLAEEVDLDPAAAARLEAALSEATGTGAGAGPWKEIVLDGVALTPPAVESPAAPVPLPNTPAPEPEPEPARSSPEDELAAVRDRSDDLDSLSDAFRDLLRARPDVASVAAIELRGLVEANPEHAGLRRALGDAYMRCGRFQKAIEEYNRAVALQPPAAVA